MGGSSRRRGERREDSGKARVRWQGILQARWHGGLCWLEVHRPSAPLRHTHTLPSLGGNASGRGISVPESVCKDQRALGQK